MDLQVCAIIVIVFLVSLVSLLFINRKLSGGKSFEDVLAEKRQLADKVYGSKQQKKPVRAKITNAKKAKEKKPKEKKEHEQESQNDSDAHSDSLSAGSNNSPTHVSHKGHVEFSEAEIIPDDAHLPKKSMSKKQKERKNSGSKPSGASILANKTETIPAVTTSPIETLNHFEQIHPKDDFEIKKQKEEAVDIARANKKEAKKAKSKKETSTSSKNEVASVETSTTPEKEPIVETVVQKDSPKSVVSKEKLNKKKKNEQIAAQQTPLEQDDIGVNVIMSILGKAELTRSEIQILIDYLLNKQQDTIAANHSDWSDDIVQKLKRQLAEKDKILIEEQEAAVGLQQKLREMRVEMNTERIQNQAKTNAFAEELNAKKLENQTLTQEIQIITDKFANEKQALATQLQQMYQENQVSQDNSQKVQQLTDANNQLTKENFSKTHIINDLQEKCHQIQNETSTKIGEYENKLQEFDMIIRQDKNQIALLNTENQHLRADYEKMLTMQKYELEKLSAQVVEQNAKTNHLDDASKVEIRNLQNALDSSNNELTLNCKDLADSRARIEELTSQLNEIKATVDTYSSKSVQQIKQVEELTSALANYKSVVAEKESKIIDYEKQLQHKTGKEDELFKQIAEFKDKNNELRRKNWNLIEALRTAESNIIKNNNSNAVPHGTEKLIEAEQQRTKQIFERLFPDAPSGPTSYNLWIDHIASYVEQCNAKNKQHTVINANNNSDVNNSDTNHVNNNSNNDVASTEELILQNAKLQTTVDEYKTIVAETESLLKKVEQQVQERDAYWKSVVELKDSEIQNIKTTVESV